MLGKCVRVCVCMDKENVEPICPLAEPEMQIVVSARACCYKFKMALPVALTNHRAKRVVQRESKGEKNENNSHDKQLQQFLHILRGSCRALRALPASCVSMIFALALAISKQKLYFLLSFGSRNFNMILLKFE